MSNERMTIGIFECTLANRQYNGASQSSMRDVTTKISRQRSKCSKIIMINRGLGEMKRNPVLPELVLLVFIRSAFQNVVHLIWHIFPGEFSSLTRNIWPEENHIKTTGQAGRASTFELLKINQENLNDTNLEILSCSGLALLNRINLITLLGK